MQIGGHCLLTNKCWWRNSSRELKNVNTFHKGQW